MLSPETLDLLRQWWKVRPNRYDADVPLEQRWLFPGRKPGKPMTTRQLNRLFHETADEREDGFVMQASEKPAQQRS